VNLSRIFIERPVMTVLITFAILLFGVIAFRALPVAALPSVDYPTIAVTAALPGASPETMASSVATPLEREFSTIAGIKEMSSTNSQGVTNISIQFSLDRTIDAAAQDVQAHIAAAQGRLPSSMPRPPTYSKVNPSDQPVLYLALMSNSLPLSKVTEYADNLLSQRISMVDGVSRVQVYGEQKFAVRVQVDPDKLASHNIGIDEVQKAVSASNTNLPTGQLDGPKQAFTIESNGALFKAANYRPIIVAYRNGSPVRLQELANVVDGIQNDKLVAWYNDTKCVILAINRQPGTNTVDVVDGILRLMPNFQRALPASVDLIVAFDASQSIRNSIHDVEFTLMLTICIVVMVIFLFLRNVSATAIPGCAVPFSIIGTFAVMYLLRYSLNNLSLMALTLSVGFVVDDAIVMLENIVRHMEMGKSRMEAALEASREIGFTILSMTLSLVAVFIPVLFMSGIVGRLLHEFSVTIVVAILISGFVSLTLTPMLGSRFVRSEHGRRHNIFYRALERGFDLLTKWYESTLRLALKLHPVTFLLALAMLAGTYFVYKALPTGFIPSQDSGFLFGGMQGPQDASFEYMASHTKAIQSVIKANPAVDSTIAFVPGGNLAFVFAKMKPRDERTVSVDKFIDQIRPLLFLSVPGVAAALQNPPPITTSASAAPSSTRYAITLQSADLKELYDWAPKLTASMMRLPGLVDVRSDQQISSPQVLVDIDRDRATSLGVTPEQLQDALYSAFGTREVSVIYAPADQYSVILELARQYQQSPDALSKLYVRSSTGSLVPLDTMVHIKRQIGPLNVNHFGQLPAVNIGFNTQANFALGTATQEIEDAVSQMRSTAGMPPTVTTEFHGEVRESQNSSANLKVLLVIAILVIYIVLGVLYESFIHPITILSGLPSAVFGALLTLWLFNKQLDLYAFVGIIMLFGVVKKNAIMMIDFAIDARHRGLDSREAIWQGCLLRFRPIMMTTVAALFGTLPIALGYGEGADARQPLGLAVVGGLVVSQFLTLYITPVIYLYLDWVQERLSGRKPATVAPQVLVSH